MLAKYGTYALVLNSSSDQRVEIGKLGRLAVQSGYYVYVGSAFGPGGLNARIRHHARITSRPHWHIDYLRSVLHLNEAWYTYDSKRQEHQWADLLRCLTGATIPIAGFGASDCRCKSHLFAFTAQPSIRSFRRRLHTRFNDHSKIFRSVSFL